MLYIPKGCAHGFQTLEDNCNVYYQMGECYHPEYARGIRWNDPAIDIVWPIPAGIISEKDQNYVDFEL
jgi:dTDP-4-dehydrorhamnose 3,5-epimerase